MSTQNTLPPKNEKKKSRADRFWESFLFTENGKPKSSLMIYEKYPELRYKYRNREFWCRGYYVDTAGKNAKKIQEYIQHQLEEDKAGEQLTMGNF